MSRQCKGMGSETVASDFQAEDSVDQLKAAWLEFSAGLVSTVAGIIEGLKALGAFEGGSHAQEIFPSSPDDHVHPIPAPHPPSI